MSDLSQLRSGLALVRQRVDGWRGQAKLLEGQLDRLLTQKVAEADVVDLKAKTQAVLLRLEETWRGHYQQAFASLGGQGINAVFADNEYEVLLESNVKRGVAGLDIILVKDGERVRLKGGSGGSVVQVLAYLLRYFMTTSQRPEWRRMEALDEPFSMLAAEQRPALCQLVREITDRLDFQLLLSSHEEELLDVADVAYEVHSGGRVELIKSPEGERT